MLICDIKNQIKQLENEIRSLKTKSAQAKRRDKIRELKNKAIDQLHEQAKSYATHTIKGVVSYVDSYVDSYQTFLTAKTSYYDLTLYPCNDELSKSWYVETCCVEYSKGQSITIEVDVEVDYDNLNLTLRPKTIRGGKLNEAKYAQLCDQSNLAFFKYPTGMSGLFSSKKAV